MAKPSRTVDLGLMKLEPVTRNSLSDCNIGAIDYVSGSLVIQFGFRAAVCLVDLDTATVHVLTESNKGSSFCRISNRLILLKEHTQTSEIAGIVRQYFLYDCIKHTKQAVKGNMAEIFCTKRYEDIIYHEPTGEMLAFDSRTQELHLFNPVLQTARVQNIQVP